MKPFDNASAAGNQFSANVSMFFSKIISFMRNILCLPDNKKNEIRGKLLLPAGNSHIFDKSDPFTAPYTPPIRIHRQSLIQNRHI